MNYYPHHIGDFDRATRHLTRIERSIYRDLIEVYYDTEEALMLDVAALCRKIVARSEEEKSAVLAVLDEFFLETPSGWFHDRCEEELAEYRKRSDQASAAGRASAVAKAERRRIALAGGSTDVQRTFNGRSTDVQRTFNGRTTARQLKVNSASTEGQQRVNSAPTNQEPRTNNQKPEEDQNHVEPDGPTSPARLVFEYWQKIMTKPRTVLDGKRSRAINGRLKDGYSVETLCKAVDGCRADPFSMGKNDRNTPYNDIELICRDSTKVDRFLAIADRPDGHDPRMAAIIESNLKWMNQQ